MGGGRVFKNSSQSRVSSWIFMFNSEVKMLDCWCPRIFYKKDRYIQEDISTHAIYQRFMKIGSKSYIVTNSNQKYLGTHK